MFFLGPTANLRLRPFHTHTCTHTQARAHTYSRQDSTERVISCSQRLLPTQQTTETNIHALSGIQTCDPSNQAAEDICLRPHGYAVILVCLFSLCFPGPLCAAIRPWLTWTKTSLRFTEINSIKTRSQLRLFTDYVTLCHQENLLLSGVSWHREMNEMQSYRTET
jgi:hypothetical protein